MTSLHQCQFFYKKGNENESELHLNDIFEFYFVVLRRGIEARQ